MLSEMYVKETAVDIVTGVCGGDNCKLDQMCM